MVRALTLALLVAGCATLSSPDAPTMARIDRELGQLLLVGFDGTEGASAPALDALVCGTRVGGVLLFGRNVVDAPQVRALTASIGAQSVLCGTSVPLIAIDA